MLAYPWADVAIGGVDDPVVLTWHGIIEFFLVWGRGDHAPVSPILDRLKRYLQLEGKLTYA